MGEDVGTVDCRAFRHGHQMKDRLWTTLLQVSGDTPIHLGQSSRSLHWKSSSLLIGEPPPRPAHQPLLLAEKGPMGSKGGELSVPLHWIPPETCRPKWRVTGNDMGDWLLRAARMLAPALSAHRAASAQINPGGWRPARARKSAPAWLPRRSVSCRSPASGQKR